MKTLITGGQVHVLDGETGVQEAAVLEDGRVAGHGSAEDMAALAGRDPARIDLEGATAMPGLVDSHPHVLHFGALAEGLVDLADARDHEDIVARIRARAEVTPPGEWIMCTPVGEAHYFVRRSYRDLDERQLPNRHTLDRATTEHPVFIQAWAPQTPNIVAFNSAALAALGLTSFIPEQVCDVHLEKDARGLLTGILRGPVTNYYSFDPFWGQLLTKIPILDPTRVLAGTRNRIAEWNALGVTSIYEAHGMEPEHVDVYRGLRAADDLRVRVMCAYEMENTIFYPYEPYTLEEFRERLEELGSRPPELDDDLLRVNGITLSPGGPCWPGFNVTYERYPDPFGRLGRGINFLSLDKQEAFVEYCAVHGVRLNVITGIERDHDEFLDIAERVAAEHDIADRAWILQHAILINPAQMRRFCAMGFQVTTSAGFSWGKGDIYAKRMGPHQWKDLIPLRRWHDAGVCPAAGTDWGPANPWEQMQLAQTCEFAGSGHRNSEHAIDRAESVAMWTRNGARVLDWDGIGSLGVGSYADLAIVDRDPLGCPIEDLPSTRVLRTMLGGEVVHDTGELGDAPEAERLEVAS